MMMKSNLTILLLVFTICIAQGQKYVTKNGIVKFNSDSEFEKIEGINNHVNSSLDITTGDFNFKVLIKSFEFEKELVQEHFNDTYMESDQYPESYFKGKITYLKDINFSKNGIYNAIVEGNLTAHGVTNKISSKGTFEIKNGIIIGTSIFNVLIKDYKVIIPAAVANNVAESVKVTVDVALDKL